MKQQDDLRDPAGAQAVRGGCERADRKRAGPAGYNTRREGISARTAALYGRKRILKKAFPIRTRRPEWHLKRSDNRMI